MNERQNSPSCERAPDLIAFLYGEADERETRDFQLHLQQCSACREEVASFGVVRESVAEYRDEALAGFVSTPVAQPKTKSALAALRQFFDLSPLWLKGATALVAVTFCVLVGVAVFRDNNNHVISTNVNPNAVYTAEDVNRIVNEALANQQKPQPSQPEPQIVAVKSPKPKPKSQRPLSKAEREQLAAELRLLPSSDDTTFQSLEDRINQ